MDALESDIVTLLVTMICAMAEAPQSKATKNQSQTWHAMIDKRFSRGDAIATALIAAGHIEAMAFLLEQGPTRDYCFEAREVAAVHQHGGCFRSDGTLFERIMTSPRAILDDVEWARLVQNHIATAIAYDRVALRHNHMPRYGWHIHWPLSLGTWITLWDYTQPQPPFIRSQEPEVVEWLQDRWTEQMLALIVCCSDGLLRPSGDGLLKARFFAIASQLPFELQERLVQRLRGSTDSILLRNAGIWRWATKK